MRYTKQAIVLLTGMTAMAVMSQCTPTAKTCTVTGDAPAGTERVYLYRYGTAEPIDSADVEDGAYSLTYTPGTPCIAYIAPSGKTRRGGIAFVMEEADARVSLTERSAEGGTLTAEYNRVGAEMTELYNTLPDTIESYIGERLREFAGRVWSTHSNDVVGTSTLYYLAMEMGLEAADSMLQTAGPDVEGEYCLERLRETIDAARATYVGKKYKEFEVKTLDGEVGHLSDYVGRGKKVVVDFWASWCPPCRRLIPELKKLRETCDGDEVTFIGITVGDKPEDTQAAIEELEIPWTVVASEEWTMATAYGFNAIPQLFLFDADGTILGRCMSEEELREKLAK